MTTKWWISLGFAIMGIVVFERYRGNIIAEVPKSSIAVDSLASHFSTRSEIIAPAWVPLPKAEETVIQEKEVSLENNPTDIEHVRSLISEDTIPLQEYKISHKEPGKEAVQENEAISSRIAGGRGRGRRRRHRPNPDIAKHNEDSQEIHSLNSVEMSASNDVISQPYLESTLARDANLDKIRSRKGTILFTHIRRAGGTVLEDYVLKPFVKMQGPDREDYLCKEGELGRYYRMSPGQLKPYSKALAASALQWRHCPFGLHQLLPSDGFIYVTMLREPLARMVSWFAYCNKYSPNKCQAGKNFMSAGKPGESPASKFYTSRASLYRSGKNAYDRDKSSPSGTFHPNNLEYRLDDNYQTRMICGGRSHEHAVPIGQEVELCAMSHLEKHYAFVAVTERYTESVCVLAAMVNIPAKLKSVKNDKATTMTKKEPPDFRQNWGSYLQHDDVLYREAHRRLDQSLRDYPACAK